MLVIEVVHLLGVPRPVRAMSAVQLLVGVDHPLHLGHRRQGVAPDRVGRQQPGLAFHEREQRRNRLCETHEHQIVHAGLEHPFVEPDVVVGGIDNIAVEERERDVVARRVDDHVEVVTGPVLEMHSGTVQAGHVGLRDDITRPQPQRQLHRLRRMRFEELVIRGGQPVHRGIGAEHRPDQLDQLALPRQRHVRIGTEVFVTRLSRNVFRHDPGARAGGQRDLVLQGLGRQLHGDVGGAVPDAHHQDPLAGQLERFLRVDVVVRVDLFTGERPGKVRQPGVPVVTVGDDEQIELAAGTGLILDLPTAPVDPGRVRDPVAELDVVQQPEGIRIGVQVGLDVGVVRERREVLGDREVLERQPMLAGVDVQGAVRAAVPVRIAEGPVPADAVRRLERRVRHPVVLEHLPGGEPADARADDRGPRQ